LIADTISALLNFGRLDSLALLAPDRPPLTYAGLRDQVEQTITAINLHGIGRNHRVAIVLPNGPELASAFIGIAAGASAAPLNPAYREDDFRFYLSDLGVKALVVKHDSDSPAIAVAHGLHIPVLRLEWGEKDPAGTFSIVGEHVGGAKSDGFGGVDDIGLVLHTSGTTSRPKMVPLSQGNLTASARHIVETLRLSPEDRCLNIMPLFHIHGLVAGVLSSLAAGASVFCAPGFNVLQFFRWMAEAKPTWYTAVPTMKPPPTAPPGATPTPPFPGLTPNPTQPPWSPVPTRRPQLPVNVQDIKKDAQGKYFVPDRGDGCFYRETKRGMIDGQDTVVLGAEGCDIFYWYRPDTQTLISVIS